jgi:protein-S-isoprenylcysteine O-methyltransferase Ste14
MWMARLILLGVLAALTGIDFYLLRRRPRHERLIENRAFNVLAVTAWNACCYLIAALPPAGGWEQYPLWLAEPGVRVGCAVMGSLLTGFGAVLAVVSLGQRKVLGLQDVPAGLLTSGAYRYFRHPIYTGILWVSLGLALLTRNPDGLLMFPVLIALFTVQALIEERCDIGVGFRAQYADYRHTTRMFGPVWLWSGIAAAALLVLGSGWW